MNKYQVIQGKFTRSGNGNYHLMGEFDSIIEAEIYFDKIKEDTSGYGSFKNGATLETLLLRNNDFDGAIKGYSYIC